MPQQVPVPRADNGWVLPAIGLGIALLDQLTKLAVRRYLLPATSIPIVPGLFHITHVRNPGAAFGLLPDHRPVFFVATGAVIAFIVIYYFVARPVDRLLLFALGLELGGALGNLADRLLWGKVTDFLDFHVRGLSWPVFNVADSAIVIGLFLLAFLTLRGSRAEDEAKEAG